MNQAAPSDPTRAADPALNASVLASAGTGKTWLLVARLVRLLLAGARPERILAITFTRKAAGEMQQRLNDKLRELLEADDSALDVLLGQIGEPANAGKRRQARTLFEELLLSELPLRATTFHSFCQELLQRFPLEAGLAPGFELTETTGLLARESWDALFAEATGQPDGPLAARLERLFEHCGGLHNTRQALLAFLAHRSDWWAFTGGAADAVGQARHWLQHWLAVDPAQDPAQAFWNNANRRALAEYAELLERHPTRTNSRYCAAVGGALEETGAAAVERLWPVFFKTDGTPRQHAASQARRKHLGETGEARFLELHAGLSEALEHYRDRRARLDTLHLSSAWYHAGARLLAHFQRIKRERRLLDFTDLEWKAYQLLNDAEQAHWIQYKLDQRIDHLLIDEFQDTNPTQWRLVLPLLEELAAGGERQRSLFLVGDAKQSIYRFRRGNPELLPVAAAWMHTHLAAQTCRLDRSWRSAPAVLEAVNRVFDTPETRALLADFQPHDAHHRSLWGRVELWPLTANPETAADDPGEAELRNPLRQPRRVQTDRRHYLEGQAIAERIRTLVAQATPVGAADEARPLAFNDIIILLRSRTHLADYEAALRDAGIPYLSMDRGTLLHSLEVRDLEALLKLLMTPQDNLALAQVLRSPIFCADDAHLQALARGGRGPWFDRLAAAAEGEPDDHPLACACRLLHRWRELAGRVPIHDLLDRIFHEANLLARYQAAFPPSQAPRIRANLVRFIELALEVDAGRYPSLPHFLARLRQLRSLDQDAPDQAPPDADGGQRVRIMTIHAAKGLEAAVVFLADAAYRHGARRAYRTLVRWPAEDERPSHMLLTGRSAELDSASRALVELEQQDERRESANLLYVALTRARQMLFVSGCEPSQGRDTGWYGLLEQAWQDVACEADGRRCLETGERPSLTPPAQPAPATPPAPDPRLYAPLSVRAGWREIAPSHAADDEVDALAGGGGGRLRGRAIHRLLQLANAGSGAAVDAAAVRRQVGGELGLAEDHPALAACWEEAARVLSNPAFADLFDASRYRRAFDEVPIQYTSEHGNVFGVIDRLVVRADEVLLVDYKTHRLDDPGLLGRLTGHYRRQIDLYRQGVRRLWPNKHVRGFLLFTHTAALVEIEPTAAS